MSRLVVTALTRTCDLCPSQWSGRLRDGRHLYIRYRGGTLAAGVGESFDEAVRQRIYQADHGDGLDGYMDDATMQDALGHMFDFSEVAL